MRSITTPRPVRTASTILSEDDGATWRRIQHTSIAQSVSQFGVCTLWAAGRHLYLETTSFSNSGDPGRTVLERSDDGGRSWTRADGVLAELAASWYAQPLDATGDTLAALVVGEVDLWITQDAGASWQEHRPHRRRDAGDDGVSAHRGEPGRWAKGMSLPLRAVVSLRWGQ